MPAKIRTNRKSRKKYPLEKAGYNIASERDYAIFDPSMKDWNLDFVQHSHGPKKSRKRRK